MEHKIQQKVAQRGGFSFHMPGSIRFHAAAVRSGKVTFDCG